MYKVIILILDSDNLNCYDKCRNVWKSYMNSNPEILCLFIKFKPNINKYQLIDNTLYIEGTEIFKGNYILIKSILAFKYCYEHYDFSHILRTNLSTFWNFNNMLKWLSARQKTYITGWQVRCPTLDGSSQINFISGTGIFIPKQLLPMIFNHSNFEYPDDDVEISNFYTKNGIKIRDARRGYADYVFKFEDEKSIEDINKRFQEIENKFIVCYRVKNKFLRDKLDNYVYDKLLK